ncbi:YadA-like family protein [Fusobacterium nucleatum]|uniref:YadA-like family protein n=1 Tax=Fusobacterium nucleatum TaxID=851 RepID=UPI0030CFB555
MKKSISLKLIVFSFLLVVSNLTYSTPVFQAGTGTNSTVAGVNNIATGDRSSAVGYLNTTSEENSSAVGFFNTADGKDSLAMGYHNETKKVSSTAVGVENKANAENSLAVGFSNTVSGNSSSTFGVENIVTGNYSTAVGYKNKVSDNGSYAFGNDNTINGDNNFVLGNNVNIGAGIQNSVALGNNSTVSSSNEVSVGSKGKERKITNVADGEVSATSTDAVTGKQLYKAMQNSGAASIENLKSEVYEKIDNVKDEVRGVGSLSAALAGLHPMQYDPKAPAQVMAALGHYKNKQAIAVGASYYFNDRFMMSTGIALSGEKKTKTMANVGFTLKLGKGSGVSYNETPLYTIQDEVKRLTLENNKQAKENQELKAKVELQGVENQELKERVKNLEEKLNKLLKNK